MRRRGAAGVGRFATRRSGVAILFACAIALFALVPAGAQAASNRASTHAFIAADYAFLKASVSQEKLVRKRIAAERRKLVGQCGNAAAESPQDNESYELSYEVAGALWSVSYGAEAHAVAKFGKAIHRLRWGNQTINREVKGYLTGLRKLSHLPMPEVCADIASWKASGFKVVPAETKRFDKMVEPIEIVAVPSSVLTRYATPSDRAILRRSDQLQRRLLDFETAVGATIWLEVLEELELNN